MQFLKSEFSLEGSAFLVAVALFWQNIAEWIRSLRKDLSTTKLDPFLVELGEHLSGALHIQLGWLVSSV